MDQREKRYTFFVIEDSRGDYTLVEEYLNEQFRFPSIVHAATYKEAEEIFEKTEIHNFDCILLDLSLPDKSGEALIESVIQHTGNIPIVVLTGYTDINFSMNSLARGISDYLLKDELSPSLLHKSIIYSIKRSNFSETIKESEKKYRDLFELSPEPMWLIDSNTEQILDVNKAAVKHYGYSKNEFLAMTVEDIYAEPITEAACKSVSGNGVYVKHRKKNGDIITVETDCNQISYKNRDARLILANDVTEKLKDDQHRKLLESVITNTAESVVIIDTSGKTHEAKIVYVNDGFCSMTGYSAEEVLGRTIDFMHGEKTDPGDAGRIREAIIEKRSCEVEVINYRKDGSTLWMQTLMVPVASKAGDYDHMVAIGRDITERKRSENELQESLEEKEILLAEIHHRVKNNLALVSGMLQMQVFDEENEEVINKLNNSMLRVETMASIHQLLYESSSFSRLEFSRIVDKLMKAIHSSFSADKNIEIEIETEPFELNINQAVPCSLIINEVITNTYKHAFKGRDKGWIKSSLHRENEQVMFKIEDDGNGLPEDFDIDQLSSLGTKIITALVKQLGGTFTLEPRKEGGTKFQLEFLVKDDEVAE
ncbi:PAS domain S-box protein [Rhodohalobacter sp. SW132]|uniref:PAS domain S-box protein n=1 Tax=Rhodohalobacter sp. SW132 TaxID=2293433 RepID=UPI000E253FEB|nr:PAS domain S-box protein [Rhodohalobacter sp. SW132]REL29125.1 PAS domain S-box protein [Rhodohalobacter sp. SW132]